MYRLQILTPIKTFFDDDVLSLIVPGSEGYLQVLTDHAPLLAILKEGKVTITMPDRKELVGTLSGGLLEVLHNRATILADAIEWNR